MTKSEFVGVDGCRSGWFSVGFDGSGCYELKVFPAFSELLAYYCDAKLILVDIPIGLPMGPEKTSKVRQARLVRNYWITRRSSVFSAPTRQTVEAGDGIFARQQGGGLPCSCNKRLSVGLLPVKVSAGKLSQ